MATTLEIIAAVVDRLAQKLPGFAVEFFPEKPRDYRLNHPRGAFLVGFTGSRYGATLDTTYVAQQRDMRITITVVMRQLNGRGGAIDMVDVARMSLLGWRAPDCKKMRAVQETYLGEVAGLWQYALDMTAETVAVEDADVGTEAPLAGIGLEEEETT